MSVTAEEIAELIGLNKKIKACCGIRMQEVGNKKQTVEMWLISHESYLIFCPEAD